MSEDVGPSGGNDALDAPATTPKDENPLGDGPTITIEESAFDRIIEAFGWHFDEFGFIVDEDDNLVTDTKERPIMREEFGGIVPDGDDGAVPIRDHFVDICDHVFDHEKTYEDELELRERSTDIREVGG